MGNSVTVVAADICEAHRLAQASAGAAIEHARKAGQLLLQAKAKLPHGQFLPWVEDNLPFTARTAQRYMNAAAPQPKSDRLSHSPQRLPAPKAGTAKAKRLEQLKAAQHRDKVVSHALYLVGELPTVRDLREQELEALRQLKARIDAVLRGDEVIDI